MQISQNTTRSRQTFHNSNFLDQPLMGPTLTGSTFIGASTTEKQSGLMVLIRFLPGQS